MSDNATVDASVKLLARIAALLTPSEPEHFTIVNLPDLPDCVYDRKDKVVRSGYRTVEQQVSALMKAGGQLEDWRMAMYPGAEDGEPVHVYGDELQRIDELRRVNERYNTRQAARAAAEAELAEAEKAKIAAVASSAEAKPPAPPKEDAK